MVQQYTASSHTVGEGQEQSHLALHVSSTYSCVIMSLSF